MLTQAIHQPINRPTKSVQQAEAKQVILPTSWPTSTIIKDISHQMSDLTVDHEKEDMAINLMLIKCMKAQTQNAGM